jgi:hypothetical protein
LHAKLQAEANEGMEAGVTPEVALQQQVQFALQSRVAGPTSIWR